MNMRKILSVMAAMMLSMTMSAQGVTHAYPAVKVTPVSGVSNTYLNKPYTIPAWDGYVINPDGSGRLRIQKKELISGKKFTAKLVTRYGIGDDNTLWVPALNETTPIMVTVEGLEGQYDIRTLTYETVVPEDERDSNYGYTPHVLETNQTYPNTGDYHAIIGDYTIATSSTHRKSGQEFVIDEIGDWAFRQFNRGTSEPTYNWLRAETVTIPAGIKKIGRGSFYHIGHVKKYVFEEGSLAETTTIPEFNFTDNLQLEEIVFPSSVTSLTGTVLGGCSQLKRISFNGENLPSTTSFTWNSKTYKVLQSTLSNATNPTPAKCIVSVPLKYAADYAEDYSDTEFKDFPLSSPIAFPSSLLVTCCSSLPFTVKQYNTTTPGFADGGLSAYYVQTSNVHQNYVTLTDVGSGMEIQDGDAVILRGTTGTEEIFYPNINNNTQLTLEEFDPSATCLVGVLEDTQVTYNSSFLYYVLNTQGEFIPVKTSGTLPANKAYLKIGADVEWNLSNSLSVTLPEETGIVSHETQKVQDNVYYTLQGTQVSQPQKGLVIKNGKKYIVK